MCHSYSPVEELPVPDVALDLFSRPDRTFQYKSSVYYHGLPLYGRLQFSQCDLYTLGISKIEYGCTEDLTPQAQDTAIKHVVYTARPYYTGGTTYQTTVTNDVGCKGRQDFELKIRKLTTGDQCRMTVHWSFGTGDNIQFAVSTRSVHLQNNSTSNVVMGIYCPNYSPNKTTIVRKMKPSQDERDDLIETLRRNNDKLREDHSRLRVIAMRLEEELKGKDDEIDRYKDQLLRDHERLMQHPTELDDLHEENKLLKEENERLKKRIRELEERVGSLQKAVEQLQHQMKNLEIHNNYHTAQMEKTQGRAVLGQLCYCVESDIAFHVFQKKKKITVSAINAKYNSNKLTRDEEQRYEDLANDYDFDELEFTINEFKSGRLDQSHPTRTSHNVSIDEAQLLSYFKESYAHSMFVEKQQLDNLVELRKRLKGKDDDLIVLPK